MTRSTTHSNRRSDTLMRICRIDENLLQRTDRPYIGIKCLALFNRRLSVDFRYARDRPNCCGGTDHRHEGLLRYRCKQQLFKAGDERVAASPGISVGFALEGKSTISAPPFRPVVGPL